MVKLRQVQLFPALAATKRSFNWLIGQVFLPQTPNRKPKTQSAARIIGANPKNADKR
jgi:hypothetical protein